MTEWWDDHNNLAMTAVFMLRQGSAPDDVVYMLEKPWKHNDDFNLARAEADLPNDLDPA
jgi:hypothetical protein